MIVVSQTVGIKCWFSSDRDTYRLGEAVGSRIVVSGECVYKYAGSGG